MAHVNQLFDSYESWSGVFFNAKDTPYDKIDATSQEALLRHFSDPGTGFVGKALSGSFGLNGNVKSGTHPGKILTAPDGAKFISFPDLHFSCLGMSLELALRMNVCRKQNVLKIFFFIQNGSGISEKEILQISKETRDEFFAISKRMQRTILADNMIAETFGGKLKRDAMDLHVSSVNAVDDELSDNVQNLIRKFDTDTLRKNEKLRRALVFLYRLHEDGEIGSFEDLRENVLAKYSDNQFTTTDTSKFRGFYVYYVNQSARTAVTYSGISPYKEQKAMHSLNRKIAISYAKNT